MRQGFWPAKEDELLEAGWVLGERRPCPAPECSAVLTMARSPEGRQIPLRAFLTSGGAWRFQPHRGDCTDFGFMAVEISLAEPLAGEKKRQAVAYQQARQRRNARA